MKWIGSKIEQFVTKFYGTLNAPKIRANIITASSTLSVSDSGDAYDGTSLVIYKDSAIDNKITFYNEFNQGVNNSFNFNQGTLKYTGGWQASTILNIHEYGITAGNGLSYGSNPTVLIDNNQTAYQAADSVALHVDFDRTLPTSATNQHNDTGINLDVTSDSLGNGSTATGMDIDVVGGTSGTAQMATGIDLNVSGADKNYGIVVQSSDSQLKLAHNSNDFATFTVADTGDLTIATYGDASVDSDLILDIDGKITLTPADITGDVFHLDADADTDNIVNIDAGALDIDASAAIEIDGVGISIDSTDDSNINVTGGGKDLTVGVVGGGAQVLSLASAGTGTNAIDIDSTAGGLDIDIVGESALDTNSFTVSRNTVPIGTVTVTSGTTCTGTGTKFLNTFIVGDKISIQTAPTSVEVVEISNIASDTVMTIASCTNVAGAVYTAASNTVLECLANGRVTPGRLRPKGQLQVYHANWKDNAGTTETFVPLAGVPDEQTSGFKEQSCIIMPSAGKVKEIILRMHWTSGITTSDDITWTVYNRPKNKKMNDFVAVGSPFTMVNPTQGTTDDNNTRTSGEISYAFAEYDAIAIGMEWATTGPTNNADRIYVTVVVEYDFSDIGYS